MTAVAVVIRALRNVPEEIEGRAYVHYQAWREAYTGLIDQGYLDGRTLDQCRAVAYANVERNLIAKDGDRAVGFACWGPYRGGNLPGAGEIGALYVLADWQRRGVGRALMRAALERLAEYPTVALWVLESNARAIRFYEECGFARDGGVQILPMGAPARAIRMRCCREDACRALKMEG